MASMPPIVVQITVDEQQLRTLVADEVTRQLDERAANVGAALAEAMESSRPAREELARRMLERWQG